VKYKVEGCVVPVDGETDVAYAVTPISRWYKAEDHFEAAALNSSELIIIFLSFNCLPLYILSAFLSTPIQ
jgi:hypothetical protein